MGLGPIAALTGAPLVMVPAAGVAPAPAAPPAGSTFASVFRHAFQAVNGLQLGANTAAQQLAAGGGTDLATAVIAAEKANLSLQLAVEVRNRVVSGYQQLMQMQV